RGPSAAERDSITSGNSDRTEPAARARRSRHPKPPTPGPDDLDPGQHGRILRLLRILPPAQLEVMALVVDGYGPAEIAILLDKQPATVRTNLREARRKLERLLAARANEPAVHSPAVSARQ